MHTPRNRVAPSAHLRQPARGERGAHGRGPCRALFEREHAHPWLVAQQRTQLATRCGARVEDLRARWKRPQEAGAVLLRRVLHVHALGCTQGACSCMCACAHVHVRMRGLEYRGCVRLRVRAHLSSRAAGGGYYTAPTEACVASAYSLTCTCTVCGAIPGSDPTSRGREWSSTPSGATWSGLGVGSGLG